MQFIVVALVILIVLALGTMILSLEPVAWRLDALRAQVKYALSPPQEVVFVPQGQGTSPAGATQPAEPTDRPLPTATPTIALITPDAPSATPTVPPEPTLTPTPLPAQVQLDGILHMYQQWNNCGPANLAMALTFWGWKGDQREPAAVLKPNDRDKNVMPYEMEAFVDEMEGLEAVVRVGGDLAMLKGFISAGYPVIVEKGFEGEGFDGWMGHYQVVSGYDDARQAFTVQDSYKGPDLSIPYDQMLRDWRAFNYTYIVIYPNERRQQVLDLLGLHAYDNFNSHAAEQRAVAEAVDLNGRDLFFALFNQGVNRVALQDYAGAAAAFDSAFANYEQLPENERPWRMMWYQTGPYFAYFFTGRYSDVILLATQTLDASSEPVLEESYYWRARGLLAMGDEPTAIADLEQCVEVHEGFGPCLEEMNNLGIEPAP
jgi:hypothetical protein